MAKAREIAKRVIEAHRGTTFSNTLDKEKALQEAQNVIDELEKRREEEDTKEKQMRQQDWKDWIDKAFEGGAKKVHRWVKDPCEWCPQYGEEGNTDPKAVLGAIKKKCKATWQVRGGKRENNTLPQKSVKRYRDLPFNR